MFRPTMCPSPGEITVSMRHLVLVTLYAWLSAMQGEIPESNSYRITSTKCRINTVVSPDDGHVFARNKHTKKNCMQIWLYLQDLNISLCLQFNSLANTCINTGLTYVHSAVLGETGTPSVVAVAFNCGSAIQGFPTRTSNYHIRCYSCVQHQTTEQIILQRQRC
jgi:hypothetical protein